jgi:hypothetical protein
VRNPPPGSGNLRVRPKYEANSVPTLFCKIDFDFNKKRISVGTRDKLGDAIGIRGIDPPLYIHETSSRANVKFSQSVSGKSKTTKTLIHTEINKMSKKKA